MLLRLNQRMPVAAIVAAFAILLFLAVIVLWGEGCALLPNYTQAYRGDGIITDGGFWSYPRYRISMPGVLLTETQQHVYFLEAVPTAKFMFGLQVLNVSVQGREAPPDGFESIRKNLSVAVAVKITDDRGETLYACFAAVQKWQLSVSSDRTYLWLDGYDIKLKRGRRYRIDLDLAAESVNGSRVLVEPFLAGGGSELP